MDAEEGNVCLHGPWGMVCGQFDCPSGMRTGVGIVGLKRKVPVVGRSVIGIVEVETSSEVVVVEHQSQDLVGETQAVFELRMRGVHRVVVGIVAVAVADGQARDPAEGMRVGCFEVCLVGVVGRGMAETVESGPCGKICHADETQVGDLGWSIFCNIP
jgi:hypothetical protein